MELFYGEYRVSFCTDYMNYSQKIFGVLNITEDSFFDGKKYLDPQKAIQQAFLLKEQGADIIDIGAASSHPDSMDVSAETEIKRLSKVIPILKKEGFVISVDSFQPEVQLFAMEQGVDILNDISGFANPEIYSSLAKQSCSLIVMHSIQRKGKANRKNISPEAITDSLLEFFQSRLSELQEAGISRERIIIDPGMGFFLSSDPETSFEVLRNITLLKKAFQLPILIGISRKSFMQRFLGKDKNKIGASCGYLEFLLFEQGISIRTHNPDFLNDFLLIKNKLKANVAKSS